MSFRDTFKSRLSNLSQNLSQSSVLNAAKQKVTSVTQFVEQVVSSEPQQFVEAQEIGIYYITDRVLAMGYPSQETLFTGSRIETAMQKSHFASRLGTLISDSLAHKVSKFLNKYHPEQYMIWNLSERSYDTEPFNDNVIEFKFPGYPAPPLEQLFQLLTAMDSWLNANPSNVAVLHCQTGKGRTVTCVSAYLAWSNYKKFTPAKALLYVCKMMGTHVKDCTIPSQTRYLAYLTKILIHEQTPRPNPLMIERIIIHGIPVFEQRRIKTKTKAKTTTNEEDALKSAQNDSQTKDELNNNSNDTNDANDANNSKSGNEASSDGTGANETSLMDAVIDQMQGPSTANTSNQPNAESLGATEEIEKATENGQDGQNGHTVSSEPKSGSLDEPEPELGDSINNKPAQAADAQESEAKEAGAAGAAGAEVAGKDGKGGRGRKREKSYRVVSGLRPYIQIFKNAKLIFSSRKRGKEVRFYDQSDQNIKFIFGKEIEGDILIRIRHLSLDTRSRVSVCRFAFHTGFLETQGVIRFKKSQLDGAWNNSRFPKDFWIDMLCGQANDIPPGKAQVSHKFWLDISKRSNEISVKYEREQREQREQLKKQLQLQAQQSNAKNGVDATRNKKKDGKNGSNGSNGSNRSNGVSTGGTEEKESVDKSDKRFDIGFIDDESDSEEETDSDYDEDRDNGDNAVDEQVVDKVIGNQQSSKTRKSKNSEEKAMNRQEMDLLDLMAGSDNKGNGQNGAQGDVAGDDDNDELDLEQFADGLDLDNVEVDSETEQNFDALLQELDDEPKNNVSSAGDVDELP